MKFQPFQIGVQPPRSASYAASAGSVGPESPISQRSIVVPVSQVLNLSTIPGSNTKDFFLWHPFENSLQEVLLGADANVAAPAGFTAQLIQINAEVTTVLTEPESITEFTIDPINLKVPGRVLDGPVFLRIASPAASLSIFVTLHVMSSEVL